MNKRLIFAYVVVILLGIMAILVGISYAQDMTRQKTTEELTWQAQALNNEFLYLQERMKNIQIEYKKVQDELNARKAAEKLAPSPEPKKDGKK
jgi:Tfp pilus assembly protein PilE